MKQVVTVVVFASALIGCQEIEARLAAREGFRAYEKGEYAEAVTYYHAALEAKPADLAIVKNLAYAELTAARNAKAFDSRERHLREAIDLLIPLAHTSMRDPAIALHAAATTLDWLRFEGGPNNADEIRTITTGAYEAALAADAVGGQGALSYAARLLRERARVQANIMDARVDLERADELEQQAHIRDGVATVDLVTIATP